MNADNLVKPIPNWWVNLLFSIVNTFNNLILSRLYSWKVNQCLSFLYLPTSSQFVLFFLFFESIISIMNATTPKSATPIIIALGIQRGAVIHHQLQLITFVNFNVRNTRNRSPVKLVPPNWIVVLSFFTHFSFLI